MKINGKSRIPAYQMSNAFENPQNDHERLIRRLLGKANKAEALDWLKEGAQAGSRTLGEFKDLRPATALIKSLYRAGATDVVAVDIKTDPEGNQHTGKLVVALPGSGQERETIFRWCKAQRETVGYSPEVDGGEEFLFLLLE